MALITTTALSADIIKKFQGQAKKGDVGVYTENHTITYSESGKLKSAKTDYYDSKSQWLATLASTFSSEINVPSYTMTYKSGNKEGVRIESGQITLFDQLASKEERTLKIPKDASAEKILMAGQGFNYYILDNLEEIKKKKIVPIRLLLPGKLDSYDFRIKFLSEEENGDMNFELSVDSWVLRMVAPSFFVRYNKNNKRIVYYKGLSNIPDENGKSQEVEIIYKE